MSAINQKEYLKKYLSGSDGDEKKKKKKRKKPVTNINVKVPRSVIVDDDVDVRCLSHQTSDNEDSSLLLADDEAPLVTAVIDERPEEEVRLEEYRTSNKWKTLADDEDNDQSTAQPRTVGDFSPPSRRTRHDSDSDLSPTPKPERHIPSPHRTSSRDRGQLDRRDSESDISPPRRQHRHKDRDKETIKSRNRYDSDVSPPRKQRRHDSDSDLSPPRVKQILSPKNSQQNSRQRHDLDSDMSPLRRREPEKSISNRRTTNRHDSNSDVSPPRQNKLKSSERNDRRHPGRGRSRHDSDSDLSPPREKKVSDGYRDRYPHKRSMRHDSDSDLSPRIVRQSRPHVRHTDKHRPERSDRYDSDLSPPRARAKCDVSPLRRKHRDSDSDLSPPRSGVGRSGLDSGSDLSPPRRKDRAGDGEKPKPSKTLAGARAGLSDANALRRENDAMRKRANEAYSKLTDDVSGRNAETVFRDKSGKKRDLKMERLQKREEAAKKMEEDEKFMQWGKGLAQMKKQQDNTTDALKEMAKPLARYKDDTDLDSMLKEQDRAGDPMLAFLKKKESKAKLKAGIKEKPKYKGPLPPPNRFKLQPGHRWDGVDRSNGFEKKYFQRMSDKKATSEVAYKWSVEDM